MKKINVISSSLLSLTLLIPLISANPDELLWRGIERKNLSEVIESLKKGADANVTDQIPRHWESPFADKRPLHHAAEIGDIPLAKILLEHGAEINLPDASIGNDRKGNPITLSYTPIFYAMKGGQFEMLEFLLQNGANPNFIFYRGMTPLHIAAGPWTVKKQNQIKILEILLKHHANINAQDNKGKTPLHIAAKNKNAAVADFLLKNGANPFITDKSGRKPISFKPIDPTKQLWEAIEEGDLVKVQKSLDNKANPNDKSHKSSTEIYLGNDITPLHLAAFGIVKNSKRESLPKIVALLLDKGAMVNAKSQFGSTPLHAALEVSAEHAEDTIMLLLMHGADINAQDKDGDAPLHIAIKKLYDEFLIAPKITILKKLLARRPNINMVNNQGLTPLHKAAEAGLLPFVEELLNNGADITIRNKNGKTALDLAKAQSTQMQTLAERNSYQTIIRLLENRR